MNDIKSRLVRMIDYRDGYKGKCQVEKRARNRAVLELWAALPRQRDRDDYRAVAGQAKFA